MEPITREEYYLAKIAGTYEGKTPAPVTIEEYYLATMAGDYSGNTPQPVTRMQYYMAKVAGVWGGSIPAPVTRLEYYWAAIANGEGTVFPPVTREEHFLVLVADAYSVVLTVVTGNPALLENSKGNRGLESLTIYGKSTQVSTTGAQLFNVNEILAETWLSTETPAEEHAVGYWTSGYIPVKTGNYICSSKGSARGWTYDADKNGLRYIANSGGSPIPIKEGEAFIRVTGANTADPQNFMFNEGNSIKPYEPYTGGKPSPSPEYPQEIESVGRNGEIVVNVLGKNLIPFPYPALGGAGTEIELKGVKYTVQSDGGIRCTGTVKTRFGPQLSNIKFSDKSLSTLLANRQTDGKIVLSGNTLFFDSSNNVLFIYYIDSQVGKPLNIVIYPQIELGTVATEYEQYKPVQTLIIPTPNGLSGIPVSSGGNYTDADGQQWVCDEVDFKKGVYVQRVATETPKAKWKNFEETADVPNRYRISGALVNRYRDGSTKCLISHGIYENWGIAPGWALNSTTFYYHPKEDVTKEEAKEQILGFINSANPLTFLGQLETPIEKPLTTEQLATYKALRTYSPTTTVANDAEAGMSVGYAKMK